MQKLVLLFLLALPLIGANKYVRQGAGGTGTGADWTNACTGFTGSCAIASLVRGDTYYVADGTYGSNLTWNRAISGTSVITIKKATIADHGTSTGWLDTYGDGQAIFPGAHTITTGYWTFDGQVGSGDGQTTAYGIKFDFSEGDTAMKINAAGHTNWIFRYIDFDGRSGTGNYFYTANTKGFEVWDGNDWTLSHFTIHGGETLIQAGGTYLVEHGYLWNSRSSSPSWHSNVFFNCASTSGTFRYNHVWDYNDEGLFFTGGGCSDQVANNIKVYGNTFSGTGAETNPRGIEMRQDYSFTGIEIYNNTCYNLGVGCILNRAPETGDTCTGCVAKNNISVSAGNTLTGMTASNNTEDTDSSRFVNVSTRDFRLTVALAGDATIGSTYNTDPDGVTRGADGTWDRGAFEFVASPPVSGIERRVCNSLTDDICAEPGATAYTTIQAAVDAHQPGDTICLKPGQIFSQSNVKVRGKRDGQITSCGFVFPKNVRITEELEILATMATIKATTGGLSGINDSSMLQFGEDYRFGVATAGSSLLTASAAHGYVIGDKLIASVHLGSPFFCAYNDGRAPYADVCPAATPFFGYFGIRQNQGIANGQVVFLHGAKTMPAAMSLDTPYYVCNFQFTGGISRFQLAPTADCASPVFLSDFKPSVTNEEPMGLVLSHAAVGATSADIYRNYSIFYVVSIDSATTYRVSATPGGAPIVWSNPAPGNNGGSTAIGFQMWRPDKSVKNFKVRGLRFDSFTGNTTDELEDAYAFIWVHAGKQEGTETSGLIIDQNIMIANDDMGSNYPFTGIRASCSNCAITNNIIRNVFSRRQDVAGIGIVDTPGGIDIYNNEITASGMGVYLGGVTPNYFFREPKHFRVKRNNIWKPQKWSIGVRPIYISGTSFKLGSYYLQGNPAPEDCATAFVRTDVSTHCAWWDNAGRHTIQTNVTVNVTGSASSGVIRIYGVGGNLFALHNLSSGTFGGDCGTLITCTYTGGAYPTLPAGGTNLGGMIVTSGVVQDTATVLSQTAYTKNCLETKDGSYIIFEDNICQGAFMTIASGGASQQQQQALNITLAPNGSTNGPLNYTVKSGNLIVQRNIMRDLGLGVLINGKAFAQGKPEGHGMGDSSKVMIRKNLLYNIGSRQHTNGIVSSCLQYQYVTSVTFDHNSCFDAVQITRGNSPGASGAWWSAEYLRITNNFITPWLEPATTPQSVGGPSHKLSSSEPLANVSCDGGSSWAQCTHNNQRSINPTTSVMLNNASANRNSYAFLNTMPTSYPLGQYLLGHAEAGRNDMTLHFVGWLDRTAGSVESGNYSHWRNSNYRISPAARLAMTTTDGADIGMDVDEIAHWQGTQHGARTATGELPFFLESRRRVIPINNGVRLKYDRNGQSCSITVYDSINYTNAVATIADDSAHGGYSITNNRVTIDIITGMTNGNQYTAKRLCGTGYTDVIPGPGLMFTAGAN
jgi:hypothetical protein